MDSISILFIYFYLYIEVVRLVGGAPPSPTNPAGFLSLFLKFNKDTYVIEKQNLIFKENIFLCL